MADQLNRQVLECVGTEGAVRLTNITTEGTPGSASGVLEIFHAGAWGTICDGSFGILQVRAWL